MRYTPPPGSTDPDAPYVTGQPGIVRGSPVPAEAVEDPQREIVNAIKAAGLDPDSEDMTQLWQAIQNAVRYGEKLPNSELWLTESGTFEAPVAGWYEVLLFAGGYGAHVSKVNGEIIGGWSGSIKSGLVYLEKGQTVTVVVGAGGLGDFEGNGGTSPGHTSFGDITTEGTYAMFPPSRAPQLATNAYSYAFAYGGGLYAGLPQYPYSGDSQATSNLRSSAGGHFGGGGAALMHSNGSIYTTGAGAQGSVLLRWHDPAKAAGPLPGPALFAARRMTASRAASAPATVNLYDPATGQGSVWRAEDTEAKLAEGLISEEAWLVICEARAAEERAAWLASPETEAERFALLQQACAAKLAETDKLTLPDYPISDETRAEVNAYRKAIRELNHQPGAPWDGGGEGTPWPDAPTVKKVEAATEEEALPEASGPAAAEGSPAVETPAAPEEA